MTQKVKFKRPPRVALELFLENSWSLLCHVDMCAIEDNDLAREVIDTASFEPIVYSRCADLEASAALKLQRMLADGALLYCRLKAINTSTGSRIRHGRKPETWLDQSEFNSVMVNQGFHFRTLRVHEVYKCAEFTAKDKEDKLFFKHRWMITGLKVDHIKGSEGRHNFDQSMNVEHLYEQDGLRSVHH